MAHDQHQSLKVRFGDVALSLVAPRGDYITRKIAEEGTFYEAELLRFLVEQNPTGTFVDVGAHIGNHTVAFSTVFAGCTHVVAFEPNVPSFAYLHFNASSLGLLEKNRVTLWPCGVHDIWQNGHMTQPAGNSGQARLRHGGDTRVIALDDALAGDIGLIKVDTEGHEMAVLRSGVATLTRERPMIVVEAQDGAHHRGVREFLEPMGYRQLGRFNATPPYVFAWRPQ
jgi:FkbM family methyltransferase